MCGLHFYQIYWWSLSHPPPPFNAFQLFNDLFKNNANRSDSTEKKYNQNYFMEMITVEGVYDYLMYVGK